MKRRDAEYRPPPTLVGGGFSRAASSLNAPSILSVEYGDIVHLFWGEGENTGTSFTPRARPVL